MSKYTVKPVNVDGNFLWEIFETNSQQVFGQFFFEEDARRQAKFMERGGAFDGWTPSFFLTSVSGGDINQKFNELFSD